MADLSSLSDDELKQRYAAYNQAKPAQPNIDLSTVSDEDLKKLHRGEKPIEFKDAPTTGQIRIPGVKGFADDGISLESKTALHFGPALTDNPKARQEIYVKHLPGATATEDKFGNPMIEYKGKKYYTSRPGEFDLMDVGRLAVSTGITAPAALAAPVSLPAAVVGGGLLAGGQSLTEDELTRLAGGTSQDVDLSKAGISAAIGAVLPFGIAKAVMPVAGRLNALIQRGVPLTDDVIRSLGIDPAVLTPELRDKITTVARRTFGDPKAAQTAYREGIGQEAGVNLSKGQLTQDAAQLAREQELAQTPLSGGKIVMDKAQKAQDEALNAAQETLRSGGGQALPLTPQQATTILKSGYETADKAAKAGVDAAYDVAKDSTKLAAQNIPDSVFPSHTGNLGTVVRTDLQKSGPGRIALGDEAKDLTPQAAAALEKVEAFANKGVQPGAVPKTWQEIDNVRQALGARRDLAVKSGNAKDIAAVEQIIDSFDKHFGQVNPLLEQARAAHADRMSRFQPGGSTEQDKATKAALEALKGPEGGAGVVDTIFNPAKRGNAEQMIDHLTTKVFPNDPAAQNALRQMSLRRLTEDASGRQLTPRQMATNLDRALDGELEGPLYKKLLSTDQYAELSRFRDLVKSVAASRDLVNPSKSGLVIKQALTHLMKGGGLGAVIGHATGIPGGAEVGAVIGTLASKGRELAQAYNAVKPRTGYLPPQPTSIAPGLLGADVARDTGVANQGGPADRLMQNAWGLLGP